MKFAQRHESVTVAGLLRHHVALNIGAAAGILLMRQVKIRPTSRAHFRNAVCSSTSATCGVVAILFMACASMACMVQAEQVQREKPRLSARFAGASCASVSWQIEHNALNATAVRSHQSATFEVVVTNTAAAGCPVDSFIVKPVFNNTLDLDVIATPSVGFVAPGQSRHVFVTLTPSFGSPRGAGNVAVQILDRHRNQRGVAFLSIDIQDEPECYVDPNRELVVRGIEVVEDPLRTTFAGEEHRHRGIWTLAHLAHGLAHDSRQAAELIEDWLSTWTQSQIVAGQEIEARIAMQWMILQHWPRRKDGRLDLQRAPFRLQAIVNRIDLRKLRRGSLGEVRFVFNVLDAAGFPLPFTVIFEYEVPGHSRRDLLRWAQAWHRLGALPYPSSDYNEGLAELTEEVIAPRHGGPRSHASPRVALRTNDVALATPWQLRSFRFDVAATRFQQIALDLTPAEQFLGSDLLGEFLRERSTDIARGRYEVPLYFQGHSFSARVASNLFQAWTAPGLENDPIRFKFSLGTCNGCHGATETSTEFVHINPRESGAVAKLSGFMRGIALPDPFSGEVRFFNELDRRKSDLEKLVCECSDSLTCPNIDEGGHQYPH
jgi:hypothetical protein